MWTPRCFPRRAACIGVQYVLPIEDVATDVATNRPSVSLGLDCGYPTNEHLFWLFSVPLLLWRSINCWRAGERHLNNFARGVVRKERKLHDTTTHESTRVKKDLCSHHCCWRPFCQVPQRCERCEWSFSLARIMSPRIPHVSGISR